jgi:amino acid transporter
MTHHSRLSAEVDRSRMGSVRLGALLTSAVTPLVVVAGLFPSAYVATHGLRTLPLALLLVAVAVALFLVGYTRMASHVKESGGFYAYVGRGLGAMWSVPAALVAALAYCELQAALYGLFGAAMHDMAVTNFQINQPWWFWACIAWVVVLIFGVSRIDVGAAVLAVFAALEMATIVVLDVRAFSHATHVSFAAFNPAGLLASGAFAMFGIAALAFVGVEQAAVYSAEVRRPASTMLRASYGVLAVTTVLYVLSAFAMQVVYGDQLTDVAANGPETLFRIDGQGTLASIGRVQLLISVGAAMIAFHNATARYLYHLGKARILPAWLGRANSLDAPWTASVTQSVIGIGSIALVAAAGWDPLLHMFYGLGNAGGIGILVVMAMCALAVARFFARHPMGESAWYRQVAPILALLALLAMVGLVGYNYPTLLGLPNDSPTPWVWLSTIVLMIVLGVIRAAYLRGFRRHVWAGLVHQLPISPPPAPPVTAATTGGSYR